MAFKIISYRTFKSIPNYWARSLQFCAIFRAGGNKHIKNLKFHLKDSTLGVSLDSGPGNVLNLSAGTGKDSITFFKQLNKKVIATENSDYGLHILKRFKNSQSTNKEKDRFSVKKHYFSQLSSSNFIPENGPYALINISYSLFYANESEWRTILHKCIHSLSVNGVLCGHLIDSKDVNRSPDAPPMSFLSSVSKKELTDFF